MARQNPHLLAFNRGEVSKIALARVDVARMALSTECQVNWMPFVAGPAMLRPGLAYVGGIKDDAACALVDFIYAKDDVALLELTNLVMRVWISDALVTRNSVSTTVGDSAMSGSGSWSTADTTAGCTVTVTGGIATLFCTARGGLARIKQTLTIAGGDQNVEHGIRFVVTFGPVTVRIGSSAGLADLMAQTVLDTGTHCLVFTPTGASAFLQIDSTDQWAKMLTSVTIEASGTLSVPTPWSASTLSSLRWTQSGDIVYVAQYGGQQYKIERRGTRPNARGWSVVKYRTANGPFLPGPSIVANLTPSVCEANGTLTSDRAFFTSSHVGALFQLFSAAQNNETLLGAAGVYSDPIRVSGIGNDRKFGWTRGGTWVGKLRLQRSLVGPDSGYSVVAKATGNGVTSQDDSATLNNVTAWYRIGFVTAAEYTSGAASVSFTDTTGDPDGDSANGSACEAGGRYGVCRVTAYTSATQVSIEILSPFGSTRPTKNWQEGIWSDAQGWPSSTAFFEGRLWWLGTGSLPVAGSQSNNYTGYAEFDVYGNDLGDSGAILESFGEGPNDRVNWALPLTRLLAGREQSIASLRASAHDTVMTPSDISIKDCSQHGATRLPALKIGTRGVFVQGAGNRVYELAWNGQIMDYGERDLTRLNVDIGVPGFVDVARSMQPDPIAYLPRADGQVACLLYDPGDEVEAWWRIMTLGVVEKARVLPRPTGGDDQVYFCVKRTVNGGTKRFLEKLTKRSENVGGTANLLLDSHVTYSGGATNAVTAGHLPSTLVSVWADGAYIGTGTTNGSGVLTPLPDAANHSAIVAGLAGGTYTYSGTAASTLTGLSAYNGLPGEFFCDQQPSGRMVHAGALTPTAGSVSLPNGWQSSNVVGYFGFMAPLMSSKLAYAAQMGSPLTQQKKIDHVGLVMFDAGAQCVQFGQRFDALDPLPAYEEGAAVPAAMVWSEYDEPAIELPGEWSSDARLCLLGQAPYPCKLGALVVSVKTNEK